MSKIKNKKIKKIKKKKERKKEREKEETPSDMDFRRVLLVLVSETCRARVLGQKLRICTT